MDSKVLFMHIHKWITVQVVYNIIFQSLFYGFCTQMRGYSPCQTIFVTSLGRSLMTSSTVYILDISVYLKPVILQLIGLHSTLVDLKHSLEFITYFVFLLDGKAENVPASDLTVSGCCDYTSRLFEINVFFTKSYR